MTLSRTTLTSVLAAVALTLASGGASAAQAAATPAQQINLRQSDLPGWVTEHENGDESQFDGELAEALATRFQRCTYDLSAYFSDSLPGEDSPYFDNGSTFPLSVQSSVAVRSDENTVTKDFSALRSPAADACLGAALSEFTYEEGEVIVASGDARVQNLPIAAQGADAAQDVRLSLPLYILGQTIALRIDIYMFAVGHTEVTLTTSSDDQPFPQVTEQHLQKLLLTRARALSANS